MLVASITLIREPIHTLTITTTPNRLAWLPSRAKRSVEAAVGVL
jgi:anaerobic glycerol-3-phosphate dehydrogenase